MINGLIIAILLAILGGAVWYIRSQKKKGRKCIGCPSGGCGCNCSSCEGCHQ